MQQSSASFNNFSRQLPFGPKTLVFGATALIAYGLTRRSKAGTALVAAGGLLAYKAVQTTPTTADTHAVFFGKCMLYSMQDIDAPTYRATL